MRKLHVYTCDKGGLVEYRGEQEWDSERDLLAYYCREEEKPEVVPMLGWPTAAVAWYGNVGIGQ